MTRQVAELDLFLKSFLAFISNIVRSVFQLVDTLGDWQNQNLDANPDWLFTYPIPIGSIVKLGALFFKNHFGQIGHGRFVALLMKYIQGSFSNLSWVAGADPKLVDIFVIRVSWCVTSS